MAIDPQQIAALVQERAERGESATLVEAQQMRALYAEHALPASVTPKVLQKYEFHVVDRYEWPSDTTPDEYLESLRSIVTSERSGIYATFEIELDDWVVYFVGRVRREWRGQRPGLRVVVLFRREPPRWITGFQARDGDAYVEGQTGCWLFQPG